MMNDYEMDKCVATDEAKQMMWHAQELKKYCDNRITCIDCLFYRPGRCGLDNIPEDWILKNSAEPVAELNGVGVISGEYCESGDEDEID